MKDGTRGKLLHINVIKSDAVDTDGNILHNYYDDTVDDTRENYIKEFDRCFISGFDMPKVTKKRMMLMLKKALKQRDLEWKKKIEKALPEEIDYFTAKDGYECERISTHNDLIKQIKEKLK